MINSRKIEDLHPRVAEKCRQFIAQCKVADIDVIITSTYRDDESQNALYAIGRTVPGKKVTNVEGGYSFHNYRVAFDFVPIVNGKAVWNDPTLWNRCGNIAEQLGLEWGGAWESFPDKPHCQDTNGYNIAQYLTGHVPA
jgi:peptidoglycan L-alanyl-D-glutamate endopeptidase CwlK